MPLTPDQTDALLRDHNTPGDVRTTVLADYSVARYLDTVEFYEDGDGVTQVRPAPDPASEPVPPAQPPAAVPGQSPAPPVEPGTTASPATAETPADVTPADVTPDGDNDDNPGASA